jgi:hypothetical protein
MTAINNRYKVTYPKNDAAENTRLYRIFNNILETVSGGKTAEFMFDFINQRYRTQLKKDLVDKLKTDIKHESVVIANAKRCLLACRRADGRSNVDPEVTSVRLNVLQVLRGGVSKRTIVDDWKAVSGTSFPFM